MSQLPVTDLYLFNHGMGFLLRSSEQKFKTIDIQKSIFKIKNEEINDVLKSLYLDIPDCIITDINFTTSIKEETKIDLPETEIFTSFIENNKGQTVSISLNKSSTIIEGKLINFQGEITEQHQPKSISILTESGIKLIELKDIKSMQLHNKKLIDELLKTIKNYTWDKDKERELIISYKPNESIKSAIVTIGYLIQMPVWKVSYRLRLSEDEVRLSGWAVVENETNDDWNHINLKLISGNPISFIYDQDKLINLSRSDFTPAPPKASGPVIAEAALQAETGKQKGESGIDGRLKRSSRPTITPMMAVAPAPGAQPIPAPMMKKMNSTYNSGVELDEYFEKVKESELMNEMVDASQEIEKEITTGSDYYVFAINSQITIPSKEKSLIPLINEKIKAKKLLYHKNLIANPSPYQAIELTNNTDFPFENGPIMVFSDSYPVGQSLLEKTDVGQTRIITYALEDRVRIQYQFETTNFSEFRYSIFPERRLLIQRRFKYQKLIIRIINFLTNSTSLIVDYYPEDDIDLISETVPKEVKIDKKEKYFRLILEPKQQTVKKYSLQFKKDLITDVSFDSLDKSFILKIPVSDMTDKVKENLLNFIEYQEKARQISLDLDETLTKMKSILTDEDRLQKNIMSLSNRKEDERTRNNFILKLEELFDEYLKLQEEENKLNAIIKSNQEKIDDLISNLQKPDI